MLQIYKNWAIINLLLNGGQKKIFLIVKYFLYIMAKFFWGIFMFPCCCGRKNIRDK